jgi:hypothetical protein
MQAKQYANINRDNVTFLEIIKNEPRKQSYTDTTEFDSIINKFPFLSNKFIYKKVIDDARVIPDNLIMKNRMDEYFSPRFYKNLLRLYQNSPLYFDHLFSREGVADQRHKQYSVYLYTLCLIEYIMKHYDSHDFKLIDNYQLYYDWALPKYSEHISYIIKGPLSKSSSIKIDFKKHYATIMNPSNVEGDMTQTLQLASLQNLDTKLNSILRFIMEMPNVYDKVADHARTYNLVIRARNTKCYNDPLLNNTFVIDLRGSDFGETDYATAATASLDTIVGAGFNMASRLSLHKLQELFSKYSRFRIVSLNVNRELYNIKLDTLDSVDIMIDGIQLASRTVNIINNDNAVDSNESSFSVSGRFLPSKNNIVSFQPFIDVTSYDPGKVRVTDARIRITNDGLPLSAKFLSTRINRNNAYNITFTRISSERNVNRSLHLLYPNTLTSLNNIIQDGFIQLYDDDGDMYISFDQSMIKSAQAAYFNQSAILIDNKQPYMITYSTGIGNNTVTLPSLPRADGLISALNLPSDTMLTYLQIQTGDIIKSSVTNAESDMNPPLDLSDIIKGLLLNGREYDSAGIMQSLTNPPPFGYGYYVIVHNKYDGGTTITTVTPTMMVIDPENVSSLTATIECSTDGEVSALYLNYKYEPNGINNDDDTVTSTYDRIAMTIDNIASNDTINIYYYDIITGDNLGYFVTFSANVGQDQLIASWYPSAIILHNTLDIVNMAGNFIQPLNYTFDIIDMPLSGKLYNITKYSPILHSNHITLKGAILNTIIERIGYGNETLILKNNNQIINKDITFIAWENYTILPSLYLTTLYDDDDNIMTLSNVDDVFNLQIEFS